MAASSSSTKSSPSGKPLDVESRRAKEDDSSETTPTPAIESEVGAAATATTTASGDCDDDNNNNNSNDSSLAVKGHEISLPTYESVESSQRYKVAKALLNNGDFEDALMTIEEGLEEIKEQLLSDASLSEDKVDFHPSLGPFHYLYGTTLLYFVEESSDDPQQTMTLPNDANEREGDAPEQEITDDTQIAYENLDIARVILEEYLSSLESNLKSDSNVPTTTTTTKPVDCLRLDLAQVRLREGDLHRLNGQYHNALADYQECLNLRAAVIKHSELLGPYDRKLADVHYNLGLTYALLVAEASTTSAQETSPTETTAAASAAAVAAPETSPTVDARQLDNYRRSSAFHYWQSGRIMCGQLAILAEQDVDAFFAQVEASLPSFKSTGEEEEDEDEYQTTERKQMEPPALARLKLRTLREHAAKLPLASVHGPEMASLLDVLQEIQETMDEAEASEAGMQQVSSMKAAIAAAAAAVGAEQQEASLEEQTTTAFGPIASHGFGTQAAAAATATAQPIMVVRKKKRPPTSSSDPNELKKPKPSNE